MVGAYGHCREELLQIANDWAEYMRIEQFFADIESRSVELDADSKQLLFMQLSRARQLP
jgi:hypothetical protein